MESFNYSEWHESCDFIQKELQFYSYPDFLRECKYIKRIYEQLDNRTKKLYQWYIYSGQYSYKTKCMIWDFLNGYREYEELNGVNCLEQRNIFQK